MRTLKKIVMLGLFGALMTTPLAAQVQNASVSGIIRDKSGSVVPAAKVEATNLATSVSSSTLTNASGNFYLVLGAGNYRVRVAHSGFATAVVPEMTLTVGQSATLNLILHVSHTKQEITVQALTPLLEQQTASLGMTIQAAPIVQLPLLNRNPYTLETLAPGVSNKGNPGTGSLINGGRSNANAVLLDGQQSLNSTTNDAAYTPPLEAVREFKVETSSFGAEYGRTAGGVINVVTKSGTNRLHGSLYEFFQNDALNANSWSNDRVGLPKDVVRKNQFGGTLGGPVDLPGIYNGHDRTFFFVALEDDPQRIPQSLITTVPTALQRQGDFSQTYGANGNLITIYDPYSTAANPSKSGSYLRQAFANNTIPSNLINPVALAILQSYPMPNAPGIGNTGVDNYIKNGVESKASHLFLARVDQVISERQRLFVRVGVNTSATTSNAIVNDAFPQQTSSKYEPINGLNASYVAGYTVTLRPNLLGEFQIGYTRDRKNSVPTSMGFDLSQLGFDSSVASAARAAIYPDINISGDSPLGTHTTALRLSVQDNWDADGVLTWIEGRHTVKFGGDFEVFRNNTYSPQEPTGNYSFTSSWTQGPDPSKASAYAGRGFATFLLGLPSSGSFSMDPSLATQQRYMAAFVQDNFKVRPNFSLDIGLRYDYTSPWVDRFNQLAYFDPTATDPLTGLPGVLNFVTPGNRGQSNPNTADFGPRIGLAWKFAPRTVFRAGYGIFYAQGNRGVGAVSSELGSGFQTTTSDYLGQPANAYTPPPGASLANPFVTGFNVPPSQLVGASISSTLRHTLDPMQQQWTANIQHQFTNTLLVQAAYTGSRGEHLWADYPFNAGNPSNLALGSGLTQRVTNPFHGVISTGSLSGTTVAAGQLLLPYPQYTGITLHFYPIGDSIYHALSFLAEKRLSHGLTFQASYTWSKEIDDVPEHFAGTSKISNPYDLRSGRSVSDYDTPHNFTISYVYRMPFGPGQRYLQSGWLANILGNWEASGITVLKSGWPIVITAPNESHLAGLTSRADRLSNPVLSSGRSPDHWFDTSAFAPAQPYTLGTDSRTQAQLRGPATRNFDFALMRSQRVRERLNIQFRAEFYNLFNTPPLGQPTSSVTSPTFGTILTEAKYGPGNRAIQFGLRFTF